MYLDKLLALEAIADEIEDPFGLEPNDLALNAMCVMIETTLLEMTGKPLPEQPVTAGKPLINNINNLPF